MSLKASYADVEQQETSESKIDTILDRISELSADSDIIMEELNRLRKMVESPQLENPRSTAVPHKW